MMSTLVKLFHILVVIIITPIWSFEDDAILLAPNLTVKKTLEFDDVVEEKNSSEVYTTGDMVRDEDHPLVILLATLPHSMVLKIKPKPENIRNHTVIRLLYERVSVKKEGPKQRHLDDPVIEYVELSRPELDHILDDLPMGRYIVCGEALHNAKLLQASCFEARVERLDNNSLQVGVKVLIVISIVLVMFVIFYSILYQMCKKKRCSRQKIGYS